MSYANGIGTKGGTSATAGRKAETIEATFGGVAHRKRVFFGQRWMTLLEAEKGDRLVQAWPSEERARAYVRQADANHWIIQIVAEGRVV